MQLYSFILPNSSSNNYHNNLNYMPTKEQRRRIAKGRAPRPIGPYIRQPNHKEERAGPKYYSWRQKSPSPKRLARHASCRLIASRERLAASSRRSLTV
uniref:Uncharacterized protein n=1 Tax=Arundo donax TaxID=35708 RepID=A0A0A8ZZH5_ARUDO